LKGDHSLNSIQRNIKKSFALFALICRLERSFCSLRHRVFAPQVMIIAFTLCVHAGEAPDNRQILEFADLDQASMRFFMAS
jgi:hypothetical protein